MIQDPSLSQLSSAKKSFRMSILVGHISIVCLINHFPLLQVPLEWPHFRL